MKKFYIAGIVPENEENGGGYSVYFPDVPNVAAGGETIEEAIVNAKSGLYLALHGLAEKNAGIPLASPLEVVRSKVKEEREAAELSYPDNVVYQYIEAPDFDNAPVRVNVSIPRGLLEEMDAQATMRGLTRSSLISTAAREYMASKYSAV
jgi:predicted RNase H-like HicB family nuclease